MTEADARGRRSGAAPLSKRRGLPLLGGLGEKLPDAERRAIRYATVAAVLIERVGSDGEDAGLIEHWEGSRPAGTRAEEIPCGARIVAVTREFVDAGKGTEGVASLIEQAGKAPDPRIAAVAAELAATGAV